jgi:hypothetical protein
MTDTSTSNTAASAPRRRPSLYRTVLGIAVAALLAAALPFSYLYVSALSKPVATTTVTWKAGRPVLTTRTSGGQVVRTSGPTGASAAAAQPSQTRVAVTTRAS